MASFSYPPITPDPDPAPLSPTIPLNPPMVGEASPFDHVDGQNRDLILESIRAWVRVQLRNWTTAWQAYLVYWLALVADWLNLFVTEANAYITEHAIAGYSWRTTATPIAPTGTTNVTFTDVDTIDRPLAVGDLVSDQTPITRYGIITVLIDADHATVSPLGTLQGNTGYGWWVTATAISASGTTVVTLPVEADRIPQVNDLVSDESSALRYGRITVVTNPTTVTVTPLGVLRGLPGFGWWSTSTAITHSGTTNVVLSAGPDRLPQVNDLVVDETSSSAYGEITVVADATHATVAYVNTLEGPAGADGTPGVVSSIVAGANVAVDSTDPANPIVSSSGGGGGGIATIVEGRDITVDATDPANPIVAVTGVVEGISGGANIGVDSTDPFLPVISVGGVVLSIVAGADIDVDITDPANPIVSFTGTGSGIETLSTGKGTIDIDATDPLNVVIDANSVANTTDGSISVITDSGAGDLIRVLGSALAIERFDSSSPPASGAGYEGSLYYGFDPVAGWRLYVVTASGVTKSVIIT